MKAERTIKLNRKPAPCKQIAASAMVNEFTCEAAAIVGKVSIRFAANGAVKRRGYAGNIQIGVIVWIGNILQVYISTAIQNVVY
jgi:hypothetical protein